MDTDPSDRSRRDAPPISMPGGAPEEAPSEGLETSRPKRSRRRARPISMPGEAPEGAPREGMESDPSGPSRRGAPPPPAPGEALDQAPGEGMEIDPSERSRRGARPFAVPFEAPEAPPTGADSPSHGQELVATSDLLLDSFEPQFQFNWQNPALAQTIYPFRKEKLVDFLAFFAEIDLVEQYGGKDEANPEVTELIAASAPEMQAARQAVAIQLTQRIAERQADPKDWFNRVTAPDPRTLNFKRAYFLDREIERLEDHLDDLVESQKRLLKRAAWFDEADPRAQPWRDQAAGLEQPIQDATQDLASTRAFRALFDQLDELPGGAASRLTKADALRWQLRTRRAAWEQRSEAQLIREIVDRIDAGPDRYPEWLVYMVIHFSGMRYASAHSSWADPRDILQLLMREDLEQRVAAMPDASFPVDPPGQGISLAQRQLALAAQRRALLESLTGKMVAEVAALPGDQAVLDRLVRYKAEKAAAGDPLPRWLWAEICKFTPLRLTIEDPNWEDVSPEKKQPHNERLAQLLNQWESKDITAWRQKHRASLDLIVTRSVCNEVAEQIQDLRGLAPAGGLTARPKWYLRRAGLDPQRAYLRQAPAAEDFIPGASILFLGWTPLRPSPWQVAESLEGFDLIPGEHNLPKPGQKGEVRKKDLLDDDPDDDGGWTAKRTGNTYTRTRARQNPDAPKTQKEKKLEVPKNQPGSLETQFLRWTHEATVVGVFDLVDGRFVMTFETGKIGVNLRRLSFLEGNPMIFVGYVPDALDAPEEMAKKLAELRQTPGEPARQQAEKLSHLIDTDCRVVEMLRWDRVLPGADLPPRVRPARKGGVSTAPQAPPEIQAPGQRPVLVVRRQIKCQQFDDRDKQGRPKFLGAVPPVPLARGTLVHVSTTHKDSPHDAGDGVVHGLDGQYLKITGCPSVPQAANLYLRLDEVADFTTGRWMQVNPKIPKTNVQVLKGYDLAGKPFFEPTPPSDRVNIPAGLDFRFRVSTTHRECDRDTGDGLIHSSGLVDTYFLVLECPAVPAASGFFVEAEEVIPAEAPPAKSP